MKGLRTSVWADRIAVWLPALLFFVLNLGAFITYRAVYAGEAVVSQEVVERAQDQLQPLAAESQRLRDHFERIEANRRRVAELYATGFATKEQRFTEIVREVKRLAREASLEPQTTSYPEESLEEYGLSKRSFVFSVEGTYFNLRKFINSLELSEYFLTLEEVGLSEGGGRGAGPQLRISLRLSTLFAVGDSEAEAVPAVEEGAR